MKATTISPGICIVNFGGVSDSGRGITEGGFDQDIALDGWEG